MGYYKLLATRRLGMIMPFGKYKGRKIDDIYSKDPGYLFWLKGQDWLKPNLLQELVEITAGDEDPNTPDLIKKKGIK
jgi:uncharacterized protein (DUF3820 family)